MYWSQTDKIITMLGYRNIHFIGTLEWKCEADATVARRFCEEETRLFAGRSNSHGDGSDSFSSCRPKNVPLRSQDHVIKTENAHKGLNQRWPWSAPRPAKSTACTNTSKRWQIADRSSTDPSNYLGCYWKKKAAPLTCLYLSRRRGSVTSLAERSPFGKEQDCCGKLAADCTRQGGIDANGTAPKIDQWNN